ncbi:DUF4123 domain-containing protein [Pseudomonas sp. DWP3-1-2]|uniref:DUF4123 domain-containing protein n=1 Tax=Pseudomonas sp. DWP3-1-2 TaxID=2804645 RepID=UPI003CF993FA
MSAWILLERTGVLLPNLYRHIELPEIARLFDSTRLAAFDEQSPLLVKHAGSKLVSAIQQAPLQWPGVILHSEHGRAAVLAHLRQILFVNFEQTRQGVLRYSNTSTASYFFPACSATELKFWLGPLNHLSWYGGTWRDKATGQLRWHEIENAAANDWAEPTFAHLPTLSSTQQQALERQQKEHFLYQWWLKHPQVEFAHGWDWLSEGMDLHFTQPATLNGYLALRSRYPTHPLPGSLPQGTEAQRLEQLQSHLQQLSTGQES